MKKYLSLACALLLVLSLSALALAVQTTILVEGKEPVQVETVTKKDRTCIALQDLERLGDITTQWDASAQKVNVRSPQGETLVMTVGAQEAAYGNRQIPMDVAPYVEGGQVYVPLRLVWESFGYGVMWENADRSIHRSAKSIERSMGSAKDWDEAVIAKAMDQVLEKFSQWNVMGEQVAYNEALSHKEAQLYVTGGKGSTDGTKVDEVLALQSRFCTPKGAEGAWNPDSTYTWSFTFVVREGEPILMDWGY